MLRLLPRYDSAGNNVEVLSVTDIKRLIAKLSPGDLAVY